MKKLIALVLTVIILLSVLAGCGKTTTETSGPETDSPETEMPDDTPNTIYVAPEGNDAAVGSIDAPLATLDGARLKVRSLLPETKEPITVYFRGGDYYMTCSVVFDEKDAGNVTYKAFENEAVRFIGGVKIDPSKIAPADDPFKARLTDEGAKASLLMADLSSYVDTYPEIYTYGREANDAFYPVELYLGEDPVIPARWPNHEGREGNNYVSPDITRERIRHEDDSVTLYYGDEIADRIAGWSDESILSAYLYGTLQYSWITDIVGVVGFDRDDRSIQVTRGTNQFYKATGTGDRIAFLNIPEEIDVPGESYIDRETRIAYFLPTADFDPDNVYLSTLTGNMITLENASFLTFSGLEFVYTRGTPVGASGGSDLTFENCRFAHTSARAADFVWTDRVRLDGCEIADTANGALLLFGGDRNTLTSSGSVIENCVIHDFNRSGLTYDPDVEKIIPLYTATAYTPAIYAAAVGLAIRHNLFYGAVHQVIAVESNDVLIEYNEIHDAVLECSDMGAIYFGRNPTLLGTVIRYNYFHDIGNQYAGAGQFGIYIDDGSMGAEIIGNLFSSIHDAAVMHHGAQFSLVSNNVFVDTPRGFRFVEWAGTAGIKQGDWVLFLYNAGQHGIDAVQKMQSVDFDSDAWRTHYSGTRWEKLYDFVDSERIAEYTALSEDELTRKCRAIAPWKTNEASGNLFVAVNEPHAGDQVDWHDNFESADLSLFVNATNDNYTLTEAGLALIRESCPDFDPLPFSEIGPR